MTVPRWRLTLFAFAIASVYPALFLIHNERPDSVISVAILLDLVVTIPAAFYFLIARPSRWSISSVLPLVVCGFRAAPLPYTAWIALPLELGLIAWAIQRCRQLPREGDILVQVRAIAGRLIPNTRIARLLAAEFAIFYFAFTPKARTQPGAVPYFDSSALGQFAPVICGALLVETFGLHTVVARWSHTAAWITTFFDLYAVICFTAVYRSFRSCPHILTKTTVTLNSGILSRLQIDRAQIASWSRSVGHSNLQQKSTWRSLTLGQNPQFLLHFTVPVPAVNLYGFTREVTHAAVLCDNPNDFLCWLMS